MALGNEENMQHAAWTLIALGTITAALGLAWLIGPSVPWLGKLPGDIVIERENFRFYFPLTTCLLLSLLLTAAVWLVRCFSR